MLIMIVILMVIAIVGVIVCSISITNDDVDSLRLFLIVVLELLAISIICYAL